MALKESVCVQSAAQNRLLRCAAALLFCLAGCARDNTEAPVLKPLVERMTYGPVELIITAEPSQVRLDGDLFLTIRTESPRAFDIGLPPLDDRLTGFELSGFFEREVESDTDRVILERSFRLAPSLSDEYRLGPIAVTLTDNSLEPPRETWFATRPVVFKVEPLLKNELESDMRNIVGPTALFPGFRTVSFWALWVMLVICAAGCAWILIRRIRRAIRIRRMSPRERALHELAELLAQDFLERNRIKDFYVELTMIVRRYIERAHNIRAPEQTTEEFLESAARNPQFREKVVQSLRDFLQSADLVKFADFRPNRTAIDRAVETARDYVQTDEQSTGMESRDV